MPARGVSIGASPGGCVNAVSKDWFLQIVLATAFSLALPAFSALLDSHPPRAGEQLTQGVAIEEREPDQDDWIASIVVRDVVRIGCVLQKAFAFLKLSPHNKCAWFRGCVHRQTGHEDAVSL